MTQPKAVTDNMVKLIMQEVSMTQPTDKTKAAFDEYVQNGAADRQGNYIGDAFDLWQASRTAALNEAMELFPDNTGIRITYNNARLMIEELRNGK